MRVDRLFAGPNAALQNEKNSQPWLVGMVNQKRLDGHHAEALNASPRNEKQQVVDELSGTLPVWEKQSDEYQFCAPNAVVDLGNFAIARRFAYWLRVQRPGQRQNELHSDCWSLLVEHCVVVVVVVAVAVLENDPRLVSHEELE
jgi:hypothetical protein